MNMKPSTLRPGLLVSLKTSVRGNVSYNRQDIERGVVTEEGATKSKWETERTVKDAAELLLASKVRNKAASLIRAICTYSEFGLLCPEAAAEKLDAAITEGRALAAAFNATAKVTQVSIYVLAGRVSPNDAEAIKAINSEVTEILQSMESAVARFNVEDIRRNASRLKQLGNMLSPDSQARITVAVEAARATAKELVKAGEAAAKEIDTYTIQKITEARTAFIDLDDIAPIGAPEIQGRAIDLDGPVDQEALDGAISDRAAQEAEDRERAIDLGTPIAAAE